MEYKEKIVVGSRIFQAIFMAIFVLGLSMILADLTGYCELPVSALSVSTTIYGLLGMLVCEFLARKFI